MRRFAESLLDVKRKIRFCSICFNLSEGHLCEVCADPARDRRLICVVEEPDSLIALETSGGYRGVYHVLHGALSPLDGIGRSSSGSASSSNDSPPTPSRK